MKKFLTIIASCLFLTTLQAQNGWQKVENPLQTYYNTNVATTYDYEEDTIDAILNVDYLTFKVVESSIIIDYYYEKELVYTKRLSGVALYTMIDEYNTREFLIKNSIGDVLMSTFIINNNPKIESACRTKNPLVKCVNFNMYYF